jgi:hypothetical protein
MALLPRQKFATVIPTKDTFLCDRPWLSVNTLLVPNDRAANRGVSYTGTEWKSLSAELQNVLGLRKITVNLLKRGG